jgi:hypothetical protein
MFDRNLVDFVEIDLIQYEILNLSMKIRIPKPFQLSINSNPMIL